jgi:hypothetical protein
MAKKINKGNDNATADHLVDETTYQPDDEGGTKYLTMDNENLEEMVKEIPTEIQDSSGVLNEISPDEKFQVTERSIETLQIADLHDIEDIEDYRDASDATRPLVVRDPEGYYILDGVNLVNAARDAGETSMACEVDVIQEHSLTELCLRKAGIRSQTRGGRPRYAELVRNAIKLQSLLLSEGSELKSFGHGGCRYGEGFKGDSESDIVTILEFRLGKSRNTINNYLAHGEYISDEVLTLLVATNKDKQFFEKVGRLKRKKLQNLQEEYKTRDEIKAEISAFVQHCAESGIPEVSKAPQIPSQLNQNPPPVESLGSDDEDEEDVDDSNQEEEQLEYGQGNADPITILKRSILTVSVRLHQRIEISNDATSLYRAVTEEIRALFEIASSIEGLTNPGFRGNPEAA